MVKNNEVFECIITADILEEPILLSTGFTIDKESVKGLTRAKCPFSRQPIEKQIENVRVKNIIDFLKEIANKQKQNFNDIDYKKIAGTDLIKLINCFTCDITGKIMNEPIVFFNSAANKWQWCEKDGAIQPVNEKDFIMDYKLKEIIEEIYEILNPVQKKKIHDWFLIKEMIKIHAPTRLKKIREILQKNLENQKSSSSNINSVSKLNYANINAADLSQIFTYFTCDLTGHLMDEPILTYNLELEKPQWREKNITGNPLPDYYMADNELKALMQQVLNELTPKQKASVLFTAAQKNELIHYIRTNNFEAIKTMIRRHKLGLEILFLSIDDRNDDGGHSFHYAFIALNDTGSDIINKLIELSKNTANYEYRILVQSYARQVKSFSRLRLMNKSVVLKDGRILTVLRDKIICWEKGFLKPYMKFCMKGDKIYNFTERYSALLFTPYITISEKKENGQQKSTGYKNQDKPDDESKPFYFYQIERVDDSGILILYDNGDARYWSVGKRYDGKDDYVEDKIFPLANVAKYLTTAAIIPDTKIIVYGFLDGSLLIWNFESDKYQVFKKLTHPLTKKEIVLNNSIMAIHVNSDNIIFGTRDGKIYILSQQGYHLTVIVPGDKMPTAVYQFKKSAYKNFIVTGHEGDGLTVWKIGHAQPKMVKQIKGDYEDYKGRFIPYIYEMGECTDGTLFTCSNGGIGYKFDTWNVFAKQGKEHLAKHCVLSQESAYFIQNNYIKHIKCLNKSALEEYVTPGSNIFTVDKNVIDGCPLSTITYPNITSTYIASRERNYWRS